MTFSRRTRRFSLWIAILALLSMQMAVAAYACPYGKSMPVSESGMEPGCGADDQANLCKAQGEAPSQLKNDRAP